MAMRNAEEKRQSRGMGRRGVNQLKGENRGDAKFDLETREVI
jgi:hypothetical protein